MVTESALTRRTWSPWARWPVADGDLQPGEPSQMVAIWSWRASPSATGRPPAGRHLRRVAQLPVAICDGSPTCRSPSATLS